MTLAGKGGGFQDLGGSPGKGGEGALDVFTLTKQRD